jgi:DNA-dependent RNA polymerase auxiliary subunit epsilon
MQSYNELISAIYNERQLIWNDPECIEENDYTITFIEQISDEYDEYTPILIRYGKNSETLAYLHEINYKY